MPKVSIIIPIYNRIDDLRLLLDSLKKSVFRDFEIIVIDNASTENVRSIVEEWEESDIELKYELLSQNLMAAGGRNAGIKHANGEYLCFIDSDNIIDENMLLYLVEEMERNQKIGMIGPLMLYYKKPTRIWFVGNDINLVTSKTTYFHKEKNIEKIHFDTVIGTDHIPNLMMVRKSVQEKVGVFDESYYIMYEEADYAWRVRKQGYDIVVCTKAITYHNCFLQEEVVDNEMRKLGCDNAERTFHFSKNRGIFIRKYAPWYGKITYLCVFQFVFAAFYCTKALKNRRYDIAKAWLKGLFYNKK